VCVHTHGNGIFKRGMESKLLGNAFLPFWRQVGNNRDGYLSQKVDWYGSYIALSVERKYIGRC
jgi:hypothetical protein